jgi:hypothetical protein
MKIKLNNGIEAEITLETKVYYNTWAQSRKMSVLRYRCHTKNFRIALTHGLCHNLKYYVDIYTYGDRFIEFHQTRNECEKRLDYIRTLIKSCK